MVSRRTNPGQRCTATEIGVRRFLTAAHCFIDIPTGTLARAFQPGGQVLVSNWPEPGGAAALGRLHGFQKGRIADSRAR